MNDKELQAFYELRFDLLAHGGWFDLIEDFKQLRENIADITKCDDSSDLWYRRGQLAMIDYLINLRNATETAYEELDDA